MNATKTNNPDFGHSTQQTSTISNGFSTVQNAVLNLLKTVT
ncbi:unnamed protein product, partial [Rotaria magnacalcarata]